MKREIWRPEICKEGKEYEGILYCEGCKGRDELKEELEIDGIKCGLDYERKLYENLKEKDKEIFDELRKEYLKERRVGIVPVELALKEINNKNRMGAFGDFKPFKTSHKSADSENLKPGEDYDIRGSWLSLNCGVEAYFAEEIPVDRKITRKGTLAHELMFQDPDFLNFRDHHYLPGKPIKRSEYCENSFLVDLDWSSHEIKTKFTPDALARSGDELLVIDGKSSVAPFYPYKGHKRQIAFYSMALEEIFDLEASFGLVLYLRNIGQRYSLSEFEIDDKLREETKERAIDIYEFIERVEEDPLYAEFYKDKKMEEGRCEGCFDREWCDENLSKIVRKIEG